MPGWFFDENLLPVGRALAQVRDDVVHPGHPRLPEVPLGTADEAWMRAAGSRELLVVTRDRRIATRPVELEALQAHGVRALVLAPRQDLRPWDVLVLLVARWADLERQVGEAGPGPWLASVDRRGRLRRLGADGRP